MLDCQGILPKPLRLAKICDMQHRYLFKRPRMHTQTIQRYALLLDAALAGALPLTLHAKTFRFARAADMSTWDVHAQNVGVNNTMHAAVYDTLIEYDSKTFKPRGSLAAECKQISPTQSRLTLRPGVKFSDGSDFSAADAKF